jgi:hypothetical protein
VLRGGAECGDHHEVAPSPATRTAGAREPNVSGRLEEPSLRAHGDDGLPCAEFRGVAASKSRLRWLRSYSGLREREDCHNQDGVHD